MIHRVDIYLDQVLSYAGLAPTKASQARNELADHLLSRIADLEKAGASRDDAAYRAIYEHGKAIDVGYGLRPAWPWIDVRLRGTARGVIAVGPRAIGVFACGVVSTGIVSCGVISFGVLSTGLIAFALLLGLGGVSVGAVSLGLNALGLIAAGVNSAGVLCAGVNSIGIWVVNGHNATSLFDAHTVPSWLRELGFMFNWNGREAVMGLAPFIAIVGAVFTAASILCHREYKRLKTCSRWNIQ